VTLLVIATYSKFSSTPSSQFTQSVTDIMRRIADMWRPLSDERKAPWVALSSQDKAGYDQEMANYDGPLRAKKDPDAPKRAMPAFFFYSQENRPKIKVGYQIFARADQMLSEGGLGEDRAIYGSVFVRCLLRVGA
jgi:hypothetical protein